MLELAIGIILGGCALGAGCAMIAGIGPGIGEGLRPAKLLADSLSAKVMLLQQCSWDALLQRQRVFMRSLSPSS